MDINKIVEELKNDEELCILLSSVSIIDGSGDHPWIDVYFKRQPNNDYFGSGDHPWIDVYFKRQPNNDYLVSVIKHKH